MSKHPGLSVSGGRSADSSYKPRIKEVRRGGQSFYHTRCAVCDFWLTFVHLPPQPWLCKSCTEVYGTWGASSEPVRFQLGEHTLWRVPCRVCKVSLFFAFEPKFPKCCENCEPVRDAESVALRAATRRNDARAGLAPGGRRGEESEEED